MTPKANLNNSSQMANGGDMRKRSFGRASSSKSLNLFHHDSLATFPSLAAFEEEFADREVGFWCSKRFRLSILCFFGFAVLYAQRVNLSIAMVDMVTHHKQHVNSSGDNTTTPRTSPDDSKCPALSKKDADGEFEWSKELEGLILGAFFWGYLLLQVPGGRLSESFGAKKVIAFSMFPVAVLNLLTPVVARTSPYLLLALRILVGVGESVMYPAAQALWSKWAPPHERSRLIGFSYAGGQFGCALMFPIGGYLCAYGADEGWPTVFYFIGSLGFFWCCLWSIFAHDTPDENPSISEEEKEYIKEALGEAANTAANKPPIPWKGILTSRPFWAILVAHVCGNYGAYMMLTKIPAYMKEVLKFDIKANGLYSMLPYLAFWFVIMVGGVIADSLITRNVLTIKNCRRLLAMLGFVLPGLSLIGTGFMECDQSMEAVVLLTAAVGLCGLQFCSFFCNHADIAPMFAGTLFGLTNTMATIPGIVSPYVVSAMTPNGTREEWQSTFYLAAGIYFFGAVWYCVMCDAEIQPWARKAMEKHEERKTQKYSTAAFAANGKNRKSNVARFQIDEDDVPDATAGMIKDSSVDGYEPGEKIVFGSNIYEPRNSLA